MSEAVYSTVLTVLGNRSEVHSHWLRSDYPISCFESICLELFRMANGAREGGWVYYERRTNEVCWCILGRNTATKWRSWLLMLIQRQICASSRTPRRWGERERNRREKWLDENLSELLVSAVFKLCNGQDNWCLVNLKTVVWGSTMACFASGVEANLSNAIGSTSCFKLLPVSSFVMAGKGLLRLVKEIICNIRHS